jgi:CubicO group peptidase (beta-lactamase class C family)
MKKIFTTILAIIIFYTFSFAQYNFDAVQKWQEENTPSLGGRSTLLIYKDGKIIFSNNENELTRKQKIKGRIVARKMGKDKKEFIKDFDTDSKMGIASCSKWLTAALVMTFVDEGKLKITDTVGLFLPILSKAGKGNITIAQCLSHTTGVNAGELKESIKEFKDFITMDEAMAHIATLPMDSNPGESFRYSNVGLQIAGAVIEKISGKSFKTAFAERIALPCKMNNTDFGEKALPIPAGSAKSTAMDYLQFLIMILQNGMYDGKQILTPKSIDLMQRCYTTNAKIMFIPDEAKGWGYGFGEWNMNTVSGTEAAEAVTSPGLFGTFPWINKKLGYAAILFTYTIKSKGRHEKYEGLKELIDKSVQ